MRNKLKFDLFCLSFKHTKTELGSQYWITAKALNAHQMKCKAIYYGGNISRREICTECVKRLSVVTLKQIKL